MASTQLFSCMRQGDNETASNESIILVETETDNPLKMYPNGYVTRMNDWVLKNYFLALMSIEAKHLIFTALLYFLLSALPHTFAPAPHVFVDPFRVARLEIQFC